MGFFIFCFIVGPIFAISIFTVGSSLIDSCGQLIFVPETFFCMNFHLSAHDGSHVHDSLVTFMLNPSYFFHCQKVADVLTSWQETASLRP